MWTVNNTPQTVHSNVLTVTVLEDRGRVAEDTGHRLVQHVSMDWADCWQEHCEALTLPAAVLLRNAAVQCNPAAKHETSTSGLHATL